jgi:D-xylose reductase
MAAAASVENQTTFTLSSGAKLPAVGLGLWKIPGKVAADTVLQAVKAGYRLFDSACDYGNEQEVGQGLAQAISQGLVTREQLWITSKLWNTFHRREHVKAACLKTMSDLGVTYLDLYLIHFPISLKFVPFDSIYPPEWTCYDTPDGVPKMVWDPVPIRETWEAMEALVDEGLVKNIGVANFNTALMWDLLSYARIKPAVLQIELSPLLTQEKLRKLCSQHNVHVTAFSSFGATSYVELGASADNSLIKNPLICEVAGKLQRSPAQVLLKWAIQQGISVIPKSLKTERLAENIAVFDFQLTEADMAAISGLNKNMRFNDPGVFCEEAFGLFFPIYD